MRDLSRAEGEAGAGVAADPGTEGAGGLHPGAGREADLGENAVGQGPGQSHDHEALERTGPDQVQSQNPGVRIVTSHVQGASQSDGQLPSRENDQLAKRNPNQGTGPEQNLHQKRSPNPSLNLEADLAHEYMYITLQTNPIMTFSLI